MSNDDDAYEGKLVGWIDEQGKSHRGPVGMRCVTPVRYFAVYADGRRVELLPDAEGFVSAPSDAVRVEERQTAGYCTMKWGKPGVNMVIDMGKKP